MKELTKQEEQLELLKRKTEYNHSKKNKLLFAINQEALASYIINSRTPNWGSATFRITKNGV